MRVPLVLMSITLTACQRAPAEPTREAAVDAEAARQRGCAELLANTGHTVRQDDVAPCEQVRRQVVAIRRSRGLPDEPQIPAPLKDWLEERKHPERLQKQQEADQRQLAAVRQRLKQARMNEVEK